MKKDLFTYIAVFIVGTLMAYFACGLLFSSESESVTIKTVGADITSSVADPDPEVFNYRAINPTVEVYVGECSVYDSFGNCLVENIEIDGTVTKPNDNLDAEQDDKDDEEEVQDGDSIDVDQDESQDQTQTDQSGVSGQDQTDDTMTQKNSGTNSASNESPASSSTKGVANGSTN